MSLLRRVLGARPCHWQPRLAPSPWPRCEHDLSVVAASCAPRHPRRVQRRNAPVHTAASRVAPRMLGTPITTHTAAVARRAFSGTDASDIDPTAPTTQQTPPPPGPARFGVMKVFTARVVDGTEALRAAAATRANTAAGASNTATGSGSTSASSGSDQGAPAPAEEVLILGRGALDEPEAQRRFWDSVGDKPVRVFVPRSTAVKLVAVAVPAGSSAEGDPRLLGDGSDGARNGGGIARPHAAACDAEAAAADPANALSTTSDSTAITTAADLARHSVSLRDLLAERSKAAHAEAWASGAPSLPGDGAQVHELVRGAVEQTRADERLREATAAFAAAPRGYAGTTTSTTHGDAAADAGTAGRAPPQAPAAGSAAAGVDPVGVPRPLPADARRFLYAADVGDAEALNTLLAAGMDVTTPHPRHGGSALHMASSAADEEAALRCVSLLLERGAPVNAPSGNGATALHWAAGAGHAAVVRHLLASGADPRATTYTWRRQVFGKDSGQTAAHWAAQSDHADVVELLAALAVETVAALDERGYTPRAVATREGHYGVADALAAHEESQFVLLELRLEEQAARVL